MITKSKRGLGWGKVQSLKSRGLVRVEWTSHNFYETATPPRWLVGGDERQRVPLALPLVRPLARPVARRVPTPPQTSPGAFEEMGLCCGPAQGHAAVVSRDGRASVRELPVSGSLRPITGRNPLVARDDALLEILGLPPNGETQEDESLNDDEEAFLIEEIVAKMSDPVATMGAFDDASRVRIFRGMITNNKGPVAERVAEAVAMYERVAAFLAAGGGDLSVPVDGERALADAMNTVVGGCDRYGHLLWAERLGDVERAVERGVTPESARRCRREAALRPFPVGREARERETGGVFGSDVARRIDAREERGPAARGTESPPTDASLAP